MKTVHLARGLTFPAAELATKVTGNFGIRGSGKSNTMSLVIEQLLDANIQVIVLDPVGIHFSIRLAPDGKHPSKYQIPVLGGPHGDMELLPTTGEVVGRALALSNDSCVLDISRMSRRGRIQFAAAFAEAFFEAKKENPAPTLIALEEGQFFMPQQIFKGEGQERMLGAFEELGEQGRNHGAGMLINTLRPQALNKVVTSLMDLVMSYRLTDVHAREAVRKWVQEKGAEGREQLDNELPSLTTGNAFVWAPAAFEKPIFGKFRFEKKTTYDAGATPLYARAKVKMRPLDLDVLKQQMGEIVEQAKANDPRALKARIAELERELAKKAPAAAPVKTVEKSVLRDKDVSRLEKLSDKLWDAEQAFIKALKEENAEQIDRVSQRQQAIVSEVGNLRTQLKDAQPPRPQIALNGKPLQRVPDTGIRYDKPVKRASGASSAVLNTDGTIALSRCARSLLGVLAQRGTATDSQISALSGYRKTSSSFANGLSELRTKGLIDGSPDRRTITQAGREAAGEVEALPKGRELLDYWLRRLSRAEATMLRVIYDAGTISRADLAAQADYSITSSSFANAISGLRVLDLITGPNGGDLSIADVFRE